MVADIKFSIISTCLALAFLFTPLNGIAAVNIYRSPALQTIFNQAEATYTKRFIKGMNNQVALNNVPEIFAMSVGMTLQRQFKLLNNNRNYLPQYEILLDEALAFMHQLAKAHNYRHPTDGSSLPEGRMGVAFYDGLNGKMNAMMIQKIGVDPANVRLPFMLAQVPAPKNTGGYGGTTPLGKFQVKKKDEITLLGKGSPAAEDWNPNAAKGTQVKVGVLLCPEIKPGPNSSYWKGSWSSTYFKMPYKGVKSEDQYVSCDYINDSRLSNQSIVVGKSLAIHSFNTQNGVYFLDSYKEYYKSNNAVGLTKHGTQINYSVSENKRVYMFTKEYYVNGKPHDKLEMYEVTPEGKPYLWLEKHYNNGVKTGIWRTNGYDYKTGKVYLAAEQTFKNGKRFAVQQYNPDGSKRGSAK